MPRQPREKSESGIYHIMLRGINQQVIFEDYEDYSKFIETLETYKAGSIWGRTFFGIILLTICHLVSFVSFGDVPVFARFACWQRGKNVQL